MPRDYQLKKNNPWYIDNTNIRRETRCIVEDYKNLLSRRIDLQRGKRRLSGHEEGVLQIAQLKIAAIEETVAELQEKYADTCTGELFDAYGAFNDYRVFCYYRSRPFKDEAPSTRSWQLYRAEFKWLVAQKLCYI